jgi:hypothetical protein
MGLKDQLIQKATGSFQQEPEQLEEEDNFDLKNFFQDDVEIEEEDNYENNTSVLDAFAQEQQQQQQEQPREQQQWQPPQDNWQQSSQSWEPQQNQWQPQNNWEPEQNSWQPQQQNNWEPQQQSNWEPQQQWQPQNSWEPEPQQNQWQPQPQQQNSWEQPQQQCQQQYQQQWQPEPQQNNWEPEPSYNSNIISYDNTANSIEENANDGLKEELLSLAKKTVLENIAQNFTSSILTKEALVNLVTNYVKGSGGNITNSNYIFAAVIDEIISNKYAHEYYGDLTIKVLESVKRDLM